MAVAVAVAVAVLAIILGLVLVVGLHEAGHALAALGLGVKIKRISLGFGKPLCRWQKSDKHCEWLWSLWPLGGYVQLLNGRIAPISNPAELTHSFDHKPVWVRISILLAGAAANFLVAWIALVIIYILGYQQSPAFIASVSTPSIASQAGLQQGDRIVAINGHSTPSWREVGMALTMNLGNRNVAIVVTRDGNKRYENLLDLAQWRYQSGTNSLLVGMGLSAPSVLSSEVVARAPFWLAAKQACWTLKDLLQFFLVMIKQLMTGVIPLAVLIGPLGMFAAMIHSLSQGMVVFLYFIASLSIAVGFINLLPLPGLDGGSVVYALVEKIRGKPVSIGVELLLHRLAFILFCVFLSQLLVNDLKNYLH